VLVFLLLSSVEDTLPLLDPQAESSLPGLSLSEDMISVMLPGGDVMPEELIPREDSMGWDMDTVPSVTGLTVTGVPEDEIIRNMNVCLVQCFSNCVLRHCSVPRGCFRLEVGSIRLPLDFFSES
jgi:hypothetical protein